MHELVHWHEGGLLGHTKPSDQLVTNIGEPSNGLKVVPDTIIEVSLCMIYILWTLLCNDAGPLGQAYVLKALTHEINSNGPLSFCVSNCRVKIFDLKSGSMYAKKYSAPN